jgi:hypothetical protein
MKYISNAFSLNMIGMDIAMVDVRITDLPMDLVVEELLEDGFTSAIGHQDTAVILSGMMGIDVPMNRINISLGRNDELYVAQYTGPRLDEGTTVLPDGAKFSFKRVRFLEFYSK